MNHMYPSKLPINAWTANQIEAKYATNTQPKAPQKFPSHFSLWTFYTGGTVYIFNGFLKDSPGSKTLISVPCLRLIIFFA